MRRDEDSGQKPDDDVQGAEVGSPPFEAANWTEHEQVEEQLQLEARKLVAQAGSPERAKLAIEINEHRQQPRPGAEAGDQLAPAPLENDQFLQSLQRLETSLATPVVSGKLPEWLVAVCESYEQVGRLLRHEVPQNHAQRLTRMSSAAPKIASQIDQLRAKDEQVLIDFESVGLALSKVGDKVNEAGVKELIENTVQQGLSFVIAARAQEMAMTTWFNKASPMS
jgi:hypothetical protein